MECGWLISESLPCSRLTSSIVSWSHDSWSRFGPVEHNNKCTKLASITSFITQSHISFNHLNDTKGQRRNVRSRRVSFGLLYVSKGQHGSASGHVKTVISYRSNTHKNNMFNKNNGEYMDMLTWFSEEVVIGSPLRRESLRRRLNCSALSALFWRETKIMYLETIQTDGVIDKRTWMKVSV